MSTRDRQLIERFEARIRNFNKKSIPLHELLQFCEKSEIEVVIKRMREAHGLAFQVEQQPYIYLNLLLSEPMQVFSLGHEITHITDQALDTKIFQSTGKLWLKSKAERQANIIGAICLMPDTEIERMNPRQIADWYGIPFNLAQFRFDLMMG